MAVIKGKNSITSLNPTGVPTDPFYPVFCAKTFTFTINQEEIEVTNMGSGINKDFLPAMSDATVNVQGIMEIDNSGGNISILYLMQQSVRRRVHLMRTSFTDDDGNVQVMTYYAFYKTGSITKQTGFYNTSSLEMRVTGTVSFSSTIPTPEDPICEVQETLQYTLNDGSTSVVISELTEDGAEALWVSREGTIFRIVSGVPGNREVSIDYDTGTLTFLSPGAPDGEGIEIGWQIIA